MAVDVDKKHKRALRDLVSGREVSADDARTALRWLRADAAVVPTAAGGVRLRVPVLPRQAADIRGSIA